MASDEEDDYDDRDDEEIPSKTWSVGNLYLYYRGQIVLSLAGKDRTGKFDAKARVELRNRIARLLNEDDERFIKGTMERAERQRLEDIHDNAHGTDSSAYVDGVRFAFKSTGKDTGGDC